MCGDTFDIKKTFLDYKKVDILEVDKFTFFETGLVHDCRQKFDIFYLSFFSAKLIKKSVWRHFLYKKSFLDYKNLDILKLKNLHFLQRG